MSTSCQSGEVDDSISRIHDLVVAQTELLSELVREQKKANSQDNLQRQIQHLFQLVRNLERRVRENENQLFAL